MENSRRHALGYTVAFAFFILVLAALLYGIAFSFSAADQRTRDADVPASPAPLTFVIDAGHGGEDGGASGADGTAEKELNLEIAGLLHLLCDLNGTPAVMTRTEDTLLYDYFDDLDDYHGHKKVYDLKNRLKITEQTPNPVYIGIHMNTFPQKQFHGLQVWYSPNTDKSYRFAALTQSKVAAHLQNDNQRKVKAANSSIYILNELETTGILVECGFLSNEKELADLCDPAYRKRLALILFGAAEEFGLCA